MIAALGVFIALDVAAGEPLGEGEVSIEADRFLLSSERWVAEGRVELTLTLTAPDDAREGDHDPVESRPVMAPQVRLTARRLSLEVDREPRVLRLDAPRLTTCRGSDVSDALWSVGANRAELSLEEGAVLSWPVFYVAGIPVLAFPRGYWPIADRKSGLLLPKVRTHPSFGFVAEQPLYAVFGRSWDATMTPQVRSDRGFAGALELRNHPLPGTRGRFESRLSYDQGTPDGRGWRWGRNGQVRYALRGEQTIRWAPAQMTAEIDLLGDVAGNDEAIGLAARQAEWARTRLAGYRPGRWVDVAAGLQFLQDLRPRTYGDRPDPRQVGLLTDPVALSIRQRWAELVVTGRPFPLATLTGDRRWGIEGAAHARVQAFGAPRPSTSSFFRTDLRPAVQLRAPSPGGGALTTGLALRTTTWVGDDAGTVTRWGPRLDSTLRYELGRRFGDTFHRLAPEVSAVYVPVVDGRVPSAYVTDDEVELLAPVAQVRLRLYSDWTFPGGDLFVDVSGGGDLGAGGEAGAGWAPVFVESGGHWTGEAVSVRFSMSTLASVTSDDPLDALVGSAALEMPKWSVYGRVTLFGRTPPSGWFIAPEELLPSTTLQSQLAEYGRVSPGPGGPSVPWRPQTSVATGGRIRFTESLRLRWALATSWAESTTLLRQVYPNARSTLPIQTAHVAVEYVSPCQCGAIQASVTWGRDLAAPAIGFRITLGPSRGWQSSELEWFDDQGFRP